MSDTENAASLVWERDDDGSFLVGPPLVPFVSAKPDEFAVTFKRADGESIGDYGWVTDEEWFDDERDYGPVKLIRQVWKLVTEREITLPERNPIEDADEHLADNNGTPS